ncbi:hypothetical protein BJ878DRAFT_134531 [Calycina marina]|uniref:RING-type domain-containing protein n=1 Tax=Calycina marina TaxID=1763456 RepID=A0A9P8CIE8_9HELO|nr:hypothetical protein BJ878DRAFT_134531 [Calycina marina]
MMVFSGLLKSNQPAPRRRNRSASQSPTGSHSSDQASAESSSTNDAADNLYIRELEHLAPIESEPPNLRELNNSLEALAAIFPDVQVEVFREMLSSFSDDSKLEVVTETLLKHKMKWVRGRYRVDSQDEVRKSEFSEKGTARGFVPTKDKFRSPGYKKAVKDITYHEFKGLSRSTINAVLAEFNHSYTLARPTLVSISSKSWRFSISSLLLRRKNTLSQEAEHHPLVIWQSSGHGSIVPTLKASGSPELDQELFDSLILPIQSRFLTEREEKDHLLALELNNQEAEANEALQDCQCCYTSTTFEELSACDDGGHFICFQCVRHAVKEAVFGQGWQRSIDLTSGTLRCVAASDNCEGFVPRELVNKAFEEDKDGKHILRKFDERLAEDALLKANMPLIRCPCCSYAEVDELYIPETHRSLRLKRRFGPGFLYTLVILFFGVITIPFILPAFLIFSFLFLLVSSQQNFGDYATSHIQASVTRLRRKRHGLKFVCRNSACARASCISCSKPWTDIHICHESSLLELRTQVELAMSLAIKRTCPRCNTSFVKSSGCNKLTCVCGYQMCYVCRKDIGNGEGYRHFCEHFRPNGGRGCKECAKCDLYRCEDDEVVVKKAKENAERLWMEKEGPDLGSEKIKRVLSEKMKSDRESWYAGRWVQWEAPNWERLFDALVESIVE